MILDKPFRKAGYFGLVVLILGAILMVVSPLPSSESGAHTSQILGFEFVDTPGELATFFRQLCEGETEGLSAEEHCTQRKKMINLVNYIDFPLMIFYGLFLFYLTSRLAKETGDELLERGKYLAPLVVIFDALENAQMLIMTRDSFDGADHVFLCLSSFTRLKWGLLAALIAVIGFGMRDLGKYRWFGYVLFIPIIAGLIAIMTDGYLAIEVMASSIFLAMFALVIFCFVYKSLKPEAI